MWKFSRKGVGSNPTLPHLLFSPTFGTQCNELASLQILILRGLQNFVYTSAAGSKLTPKRSQYALYSALVCPKSEDFHLQVHWPIVKLQQNFYDTVCSFLPGISWRNSRLNGELSVKTPLGLDFYCNYLLTDWLFNACTLRMFYVRLPTFAAFPPIFFQTIPGSFEILKSILIFLSRTLSVSQNLILIIKKDITDAY